MLSKAKHLDIFRPAKCEIFRCTQNDIMTQSEWEIVDSFRRRNHLTVKTTNLASNRLYLALFSWEKSVQSWHGRLVFFYHLITLSALYSIDCGIVRPICFAVLRLITSSNLVGCSTGRSAGLVPSGFCPRNMQRAGSCPRVRPVGHEPTSLYRFLCCWYTDGSRLFNAKSDDPLSVSAQ